MSDEFLHQVNDDALGAAAPAPPEEQPHPIATAINGLVHRARDVNFAARQFMPIAIEVKKRQSEEILNALEKKTPLLEDLDRHTRVLAPTEHTDSEDS